MAYRRTPKVLEHQEQTKQAIVRAASALVRAERPITMEAVANKAGLSVGSLYTYFRNRADLLLALFEYRAAQELTVMEQALQDDVAADAALARAVGLQLERGFASPGMTLFLLLERMDRDPRLEQAKLAYHRKHCAALARCIQRGVQAGTFPAQQADVSAAAILGAIIEVLTRAVAGEGEPLRELSRKDLEDALVQTVFGICGRRFAAR
jgi:AcrR family transcriptional regulator